jgi:hypothetical protein
MVKTCRSCLNMFEGHISIDNCPMRECGGWELIEIDDMLAAVIIRFWTMGISTAFCCSGHLYETCFSPHVMFDEPRCDEGREALTHLRNILLELNEADNLVDIGEIEPLRDMYTFTVSAKKCHDDPILRLEVQSDFLSFLYEASELFRAEFFEDCNCAHVETQ